MITLTNDQVRKNLPWSKLVAMIEDAIRAGTIAAPQRSSYRLDGATATGNLLIMPAWQGDTVIGMKTVTVWPDNDTAGLPSHGANYLLMDARTGALQAVLDGEELTTRRTAAISVIAAKRLMRPDARRLLVIGAGPVAACLVEAFSAQHRFDAIDIYARNPDRAAAVARQLTQKGIAAAACTDLAKAAGMAEVISMATSARTPVLRGEWIAPGTHIDLVGSFTPEMREVDDAVITRADAIWLDTRAALAESGDMTQPLASGVLQPAKIRGDLAALLDAAPDRKPADITLFKAVGFALPDFAAAQCALAGGQEPLSLIA